MSASRDFFSDNRRLTSDDHKVAPDDQQQLELTHVDEVDMELGCPAVGLPEFVEGSSVRRIPCHCLYFLTFSGRNTLPTQS